MYFSTLGFGSTGPCGEFLLSRIGQPKIQNQGLVQEEVSTEDPARERESIPGNTPASVGPRS